MGGRQQGKWQAGKFPEQGINLSSGQIHICFPSSCRPSELTQAALEDGAVNEGRREMGGTLL